MASACRMFSVISLMGLCASCAESPMGPSPAISASQDGTLQIIATRDAGPVVRFIGRFDGTLVAFAGIDAPAVPAAPTSLTATVSGDTVTLSWTAAGGSPTSYVIEAGSSSGASDLANFDTGSGSTTLMASDVDPGTYFVRVRARNGDGTSGPSNEVTAVVTVPCTAAPGAPRSFMATVSGSTVSLTWQKPASGGAPTSYVLEAGSTSGSRNLFNSGIGNTTSLTASAANRKYFARVRGRNSCGTGAASNEASFTVGSPGPSLTGRWVGLAPDGLIINDPTSCEAEQDLQLDLTQTGSTISGTATSRTRKLTPGQTCGVVGFVETVSLFGSVSGTTVTLTLQIEQQNRGDLNLTGTVTGNRMSGNAVGYPATFAVTKE